MSSIFKSIISLLNLVNVHDEGHGLYKGPAVKKLDNFLERFYTGKDNPDELSQEINDWAHNINLTKEFDPWLRRTKDSHLNLRVRPRKKFRLSLYYLSPHSSHPPHSHHRLSSVQILIKGRMQLREYHTVQFEKKELKLRKVIQRDLVPYEPFFTSRDYHNVHWFGTYDEPALILSYSVNFGILGKYNLWGRPVNGRYYVDANLKPSKEGIIKAPLLTEDQAARNFSGPIQEF